MADYTVTPVSRAWPKHAIDVSDAFSEDEDKVNAVTPEWKALEAERIVCKRLWGGTAAMRASGEAVLRKWEGESVDEYTARKDQATLTNYFRNTVETAVDDAYQEPLSLTPDGELEREEVATLEEWWENVDRRKSSGTQCARDTSESSLAFGRPAILVDFPTVTEQAESAVDEPQRWPRVKEISASNILEPVWAEVDGDLRLVSVRYYDPVSTPNPNGVGSTRTERIVILKRGGDGESEYARMEIYEQDDGGEYPSPGSPTETRLFQPPARLSAERKAEFVEIPLVFKLTGRGPQPKMLGLAELNSKHYGKSSDFDLAVEVAGVPFDIFIGFSDDDMKAYQRGAYRFLNTTKSPQEATRIDGSFKFDSAKVSLEDLKRLEDAMAYMAKMPKQTRATGSERATIRMRDDKAKLSRLQAWFLQWLAADQAVLDWGSLWLGLSASATLGYSREVFEALDEGDFAGLLDLFDRVVEYPEPLQEVALQEAQRYGALDKEIHLLDYEDEGGAAQPGLLTRLGQSGPTI